MPECKTFTKNKPYLRHFVVLHRKQVLACTYSGSCASLYISWCLRSLVYSLVRFRWPAYCLFAFTNKEICFARFSRKAHSTQQHKLLMWIITPLQLATTKDFVTVLLKGDLVRVTPALCQCVMSFFTVYQYTVLRVDFVSTSERNLNIMTNKWVKRVCLTACTPI